MPDYYLSANGQPVTRMVLHVPNRGPWWTELDFADDADRAQGAIAIRVGSVELFGSEDLTASGKFAGQRKLRVVAGAGGWGTLLAAKAYHNDAGVPRSTVAGDAADEAGETLGTFAPTERLQVDYVRPSGQASQSLEYAAGSTPWWVDFEGVTHVAARTGAARKLTVLQYNPRDRWAELDVDSISDVAIGDTITDKQGRIDGELTARELEVTIDGAAGSLQFRIWHSDTSDRGSLATVVEQVVRRAAYDDRLLGCYRYRVIRMAGDRVDLQVVRRDIGLPDLVYVSMTPGLAGAHATLTKGSEVLVSFIDGDRRAPVITNFTGKGGLGFVPAALDLCGNGSGFPVMRQGDLVISGGVGTVVTLWPVTGSPAPPNAAVVAGVPHLISFDPIVPTPLLAAPLIGAGTSGSALVRAG